MKKRVEIISKTELFKKLFFKIDEVRLRHELFSGEMSDEINRLNFDRGDSVAGVIHNPEKGSILLVNQFRYPTYEKDTGWLLELPAGVLEDGEDPRVTFMREVKEEMGYEVNDVRHISTFYLSPGGTSERIHLFYAKVSDQDKTAKGGGLKYEGEDIQIVSYTLDEIRMKMANSEIMDAKTLIGLQWLQLNKDKLS